MGIRAGQEKVLCIARDALPPSWLEKAAAIKMSSERFYECLEGVSMRWMPRRLVESDAAYKQVIPYVVLQTLDGLHTACYRRNGTEARLHALWSIGIGGHINDGDCPASGMTLSDIVAHGMARELNEEFKALPSNIEPVFHGIINEEQTPVGHVHLGLVYRILVSDRDGFRPGRELEAFAWMDEDEILSRPLELWSHLALNLLDAEE
jgi:predicted NUDIX family phosphoesterase